MATRQANAAPANDRVRLNMQQVREQQELNRERKAQQESAAERTAAARDKTKSQYAHVSSRVSAATASAIAAGAGAAAAGSGRGAAAALRGLQGKPQQQQQQVEDDVKITVFVRECDPDGGVFSIFESEVIKQQQVALAQAAQGGAGNVVGARGPSAAPLASGRNPAGGRAPSQAAPATSTRSTAGPSAPAAFGRGAPTASRAAPPAAPTTPLQPLPHNVASQGPAFGAAPAVAGGAGARGAVPDYLRQRKQQLQDEKDRIAQTLADEKKLAQYPPGHRPLAEEERQAILSKLATRKKELEADLGRLPLRFDTLAVKNKRQEITTEMNEVDEAVQKFSVKKQLYVPV